MVFPDEKMHLDLVIVTPERRLDLPKLRQVVLQTPQGEAGLLPGHAALVSLVDCGTLRAYADGVDPEKPPQRFVVRAGHIRAIGDALVLVTPEVVREDELNAETAQAELDEAEAMLATLDPVHDAADHGEWAEAACFFEALLALDHELAHRHR